MGTNNLGKSGSRYAMKLAKTHIFESIFSCTCLMTVAVAVTEHK